MQSTQDLVLNILTFTHQEPATTAGYRTLIYDAFKVMADVRRSGFTGDGHFWFREPAKDENGLHAYKKFILRVSIKRYSGGSELAVMYDGLSFLWPQSILDYPGDATDFGQVVSGGLCFRYDGIGERPDPDLSETYPVMSLKIRKQYTFHPFPKTRKTR